MPEGDPRPRVFVGSSYKGRNIANEIKPHLDNICDVVVWDQGVFGPGQALLARLVASAEASDFAILVLTADDLLVSGDVEKLVPRDNVVFELGLFMGTLGTEHTFMVMDRRNPPVLPEDLAGIIAAQFEMEPGVALKASLEPACTAIREAIERLGPRPRPPQPPKPPDEGRSSISPDTSRPADGLLADLWVWSLERLAARRVEGLSSSELARLKDDVREMIRLLRGFD